MKEEEDNLLRFGTRPVCIAGSLLSSLGLAFASFADTLEHVMVAYRSREISE